MSFVTDEAALDYLEELEPEYAKADRVPYLRARAIHGDRGAVAELLERVEKEPSVRFRSRWRGDSDELNALISVDTPEATEAMKRYVRDSWPSRSDVLDDFYIISSSSAVRLENEAGNFRRDSVLAEVARRDPHWLAETALQKMGSDSQEARIYAADIFEQLTGQNGGYNPKAFARERAEPLKGLAAWWQAHKGENREQWLIAYFNEKGFPLTNFDQKNLSILVEALSGDYRLHYFAVEQISVICGKYFTSFRRLESQKNLEAMKARIVGWLKARGYL